MTGHQVGRSTGRCVLRESRTFRGYQTEFANPTRPALLQGYFQHEQYFTRQADEIVATLRPAPGTVGDLVATLRGTGRPIVARSLRAAPDYGAMGWVLDYSWYLEALSALTDRVDIPQFVVTSDIPLLAQVVVDRLGSICPAVDCSRLSSAEQLRITAAADHAILANSSFSRWGAWLGDRRCGFSTDRVVIAPTPWTDLPDRPTGPVGQAPTLSRAPVRENLLRRVDIRIERMYP